MRAVVPRLSFLVLLTTDRLKLRGRERPADRFIVTEAENGRRRIGAELERLPEIESAPHILAGRREGSISGDPDVEHARDRQVNDCRNNGFFIQDRHDDREEREVVEVVERAVNRIERDPIARFFREVGRDPIPFPLFVLEGCVVEHRQDVRADHRSDDHISVRERGRESASVFLRNAAAAPMGGDDRWLEAFGDVSGDPENGKQLRDGVTDANLFDWLTMHEQLRRRGGKGERCGYHKEPGRFCQSDGGVGRYVILRSQVE